MDLVPTAQAFQLLMDGSAALAQMEANGVKIHVPRLERTITRTEEHIKELEAELQTDKVFTLWRKEFGREANLGSNPQLAHILYEKMGIKCKAWTSGGTTGVKKKSVSEKALQDVDHPFVRKLFEVRHLKKTVSTFLKGMRAETVSGFLHPFFHLHTVVTFRSSSSHINWQNLPRRDPHMARLVRRCVIARKGRYLWELDFKGAEVTTAAVVTGDANLISYVKDKSRDMHRDCAMDLYLLEEHQVSKPIRNSAKQWFVFAEFYGDYYVHCAKNLWEAVDREKLTLTDGTPLRKHLKRKKLRDMGDCDPEQDTRPGTYEAHVKRVEEIFWNQRFPGYRDWKKQWWADYQNQGRFITPSGFLVQWGKGGPLAKNDAINSPIQGPSFHCLLFTLIRLQKWLNKNKFKTCLVGQIHDSLIGDSPPDEIDRVLNEAKRIIAEDLPRFFPWLTVPMEIECEVSDVGASWYEKREWRCDNNRHWGAAA